MKVEFLAPAEAELMEAVAYYNLYHTRAAMILVVAVQNLHRDPNSWKSCLPASDG